MSGMGSQAMPHDYWDNLNDQGDRESEQANARFYGLKAEEYAVERWGFEQYETGHSDLVIPYDHRFADRSPPSTGADQRRYPGNRRLIQVKGARLKTKINDRGRPGRFRLWDSDHAELVEKDALYLFLGYEPDNPSPVESVRFIDARELDSVVELNWYDASHSTKSGRPTDLSVRSIFPGK